MPPPPMILNQPGKIRFAAGEPTGRRSLTWTVTGWSNQAGKDEVYIGNRQTMGHSKLSLHEADARRGLEPGWILALTDEYSKAEGFNANRRIFRLDEAPEIAQGWRVAAKIMTPNTLSRQHSAGAAPVRTTG